MFQIFLNNCTLARLTQAVVYTLTPLIHCEVLVEVTVMCRLTDLGKRPLFKCLPFTNTILLLDFSLIVIQCRIVTRTSAQCVFASRENIWKEMIMNISFQVRAPSKDTITKLTSQSSSRNILLH